MTRYLGLGDSISIDEYTGVRDGGAASQFARLLNASQFQNLTYDGCVTQGVLDVLGKITIRPDVITVTAGGNDLLMSAMATGPVERSVHERVPDVHGIEDRLRTIVHRLKFFEAPIILSTIYDPTDGSDAHLAELRFPEGMRAILENLNERIRRFAEDRKVIVCDLEALFRGHGFWSTESWIVKYIEPNHAGATAIARHWHELFKKC